MHRSVAGTRARRLVTLALGLLISTAQPTLTGTAHADNPPAMPPFGTDSVAILGCSNTSHHSLGYRAQSSLDQLVYTDMAGLMFDTWGDPADHEFDEAWSKYDSQRPESGYQAAWVMPCILGSDGYDSEALMTEVVHQIELRDGDIPIFVSPFSEYPPEHLCSPLGARGFDLGVALMEWSAANLGTLYGPITGMVTVDLMQDDGCHLNDDGITLVGDQLMDWFDNGGWQAGYVPSPDPDRLPTIDPYSISAPMGVVGCANTFEHLLGYEEVSNADKFWASSSLSGYESGYLGIWANGDTGEPSLSYWAELHDNGATQPPTAVWLQICVARDDNSPLTSSLEQQVDLRYVIERVSGELPGVPVIVSARSPLATGACAESGMHGDSNSAALVDWAVEHNLAYRGPSTGPVPASQLESDGCSLTDEGMAAAGEQLAAFFDEPGSPDTAPPSNPTDLAATSVSHESAWLTWSASVDNVAVDHYVIERDGAEIGTSLSTGFVDSGLAPLTSYSYIVFAEDRAGIRSGPSNELSLTTPDVDTGLQTGQFTASTYTAAVGEVITFSDSHSGTHRRIFQFGNGTQASTRTNGFDYSYLVAGTYTVTLETKDVSTGSRTTLSLVVVIG